MSALPWPRPCADSADSGIADQRLVALPQLGIERGDDRFTVLSVVLGFRFVATDDIANAFGFDLLDEELRLSRPALEEEGHERIVVLEHDLAHDGLGALARAEDVLQLALLEPGDSCGRDHAAVGDDADPADGKAPLQAIDDRQQRRHVGGIARPHLGADRPAVAVDDEAKDHLLQIGPKVLGIAVFAQWLAALAVEGEAGGVHEHGGEVGEQVAAAIEQPLLDQVLDAARRQRPIRLLLQFLAQAGPSPDRSDAGRAPRPRGCRSPPSRRTVAVGSQNEQTMQGGDEDGALDRELERPLHQQVGQHGVDPEPLPDPSNSSGPPIRLAATDSAPSASSSSALISST